MSIRCKAARSIRFTPVILSAVCGMVLAVGHFQTSARASQAPSLPPVKPGQMMMYGAVGHDLVQYDLNTENGTLTERRRVTFPEDVFYSWPHPSLKYIYVGWSANLTGKNHGLTTLRVDPKTGALEPHGQPVTLPARMSYVTLDVPARYMLISYPQPPSRADVFRMEPDGTVGPQIKQSPDIDGGIWSHMVRVDRNNKMVILVTRGHAPADGKPGEPGALKIYGYKDGILTNRRSIAPKGQGFQVRHIEAHPNGQWWYVDLEQQNLLKVYKKVGEDDLAPEELFSKNTLADPAKSAGQAGQIAGPLHMHPNGRFVYVRNRGPVGADNSIAVFSINQQTGEPTLIQNIDSRGLIRFTSPSVPMVSTSLAVIRVDATTRAGSSPLTSPCFG